MIAELMKSYRAVLCSRCNEPIPASSRVISLLIEAAHRDRTVPHKFIARCKLCGYESVYANSDVRTFDGEPRNRNSRARAPGV
jgi:hypothetical protein